MTSFLTRSCVILVEPTLPENVGAVARAMTNFGVGELRLVNPCDYLNEASLSLAAHSTAVLRNATCYGSLTEATQDLQCIIGTTARRRDRFADPVSLPNLTDHRVLGGDSMGLVFGRESSGLTNQELACCDLTVMVPTFGASQSLNLAQAVMVVLYELSRSLSAVDSKEPLAAMASSKEVEGLKEHLFLVLRSVGFLRSHQRETLWQRFSDLIARSGLGSADIRLIRGFLRRTENRLRLKNEESSKAESEDEKRANE